MRTSRFRVFRIGVAAALVVPLTLAACSANQPTGNNGGGGGLGAGAVPFDATGLLPTQANGINAAGEMVGSGVDNLGVRQGWLWHNNTFSMFNVTFSGGSATVGNAISASGDIVGTYVAAADTKNHGFLLSGSTYTVIDYPSAPSTQPFGINTAGDIVGQYNVATVQHAFLLHNGSYTNIDPPGALRAAARGINDNGDVAGWVGDNTGLHGYVWLNGAASPTLVDFPGADSTLALGINASGDIVGFYYDHAQVFHGFLKRGTTMESVDVPNALDTNDKGINDSGVIVGTYIGGDTFGHGFYLFTH